jgi:mitosis inhibitor protein kinase SWE1
LRLREEVDILQHLARAAAAEGGQHSNVLAYIDSWEQDEVLFIRTELCELGNFERFLWEYGRAFPRLEEARVWKIFVDLSNVSKGPIEKNFLHQIRFSVQGFERSLLILSPLCRVFDSSMTWA